jgi:hypothetical protein
MRKERREDEHTKERGDLNQRLIIRKHEVYIAVTFGQVI